MKFLASLFLATTVFSGSALAGEPTLEPAPAAQLPMNGSCTSADGSVVYESFRYQGGAAPYAGMLTGKKVLTVDGFEWGIVTTYQYGGENPGQDNWPLSIELVDDVVLTSEGGPMAGSSVYTALVTVEHLTADVAPVTKYMICESKWIFLAP